MAEGATTRPLRVMALLKTSTGGQWIAPLMAGLQARGHEVLVLVPDPDEVLGRMLRSRGIPVAHTPAPAPSRSPLRQVAAVRELRKLISGWRPDVVNYHLYTSALAGRFACRGLDAVTVHMIPGPLYLEAPLVRWVERWLCRLDDHIICSSSCLYRAYSDLGVPGDALSYVPYSLDFASMVPASAEARIAARCALDLPERGFVAVSVAWFYPPKRLVHRGKGLKGHEVLLAGWRRYRDRGGKGTLLLVGKGVGESGDRYRDALRNSTEGRILGSSVRWVGHRDDVPMFYAAADVNVLASWSENYGSVGEASAAGVPTIATAVGGIPELVQHGATGWLFPAGDGADLAHYLATAERLHPDGRLAAMGMRARRRVAAVADQPESVRDYCDAIERTAQRHPQT